MSMTSLSSPEELGLVTSMGDVRDGRTVLQNAELNVYDSR